MIDYPLIRATAGPWWDGVELLIGSEKREGHSIYVVKPENIILTQIDEMYATEPSLRISRTAAQTLIDDLWMSGLRPTEGTGSAGSLKATQNHLNDMRKIVEKKLDIILK